MSAVLISSCVPSKFYLHFISLGERHFVSQAWRSVDLKSVRLYDNGILQIFFSKYFSVKPLAISAENEENTSFVFISILSLLVAVASQALRYQN